MTPFMRCVNKLTPAQIRLLKRLAAGEKEPDQHGRLLASWRTWEAVEISGFVHLDKLTRSGHTALRALAERHEKTRIPGK